MDIYSSLVFCDVSESSHRLLIETRLKISCARVCRLWYNLLAEDLISNVCINHSEAYASFQKLLDENPERRSLVKIASIRHLTDASAIWTKPFPRLVCYHQNRVRDIPNLPSTLQYLCLALDRGRYEPDPAVLSRFLHDVLPNLTSLQVIHLQGLIKCLILDESLPTTHLPQLHTLYISFFIREYIEAALDQTGVYISNWKAPSLKRLSIRYHRNYCPNIFPIIQAFSSTLECLRTTLWDHPPGLSPIVAPRLRRLDISPRSWGSLDGIPRAISLETVEVVSICGVGRLFDSSASSEVWWPQSLVTCLGGHLALFMDKQKVPKVKMVIIDEVWDIVEFRKGRAFLKLWDERYREAGTILKASRYVKGTNQLQDIEHCDDWARGNGGYISEDET